MFTLLSPSALLALLGLLVPIAIHLWNRRPGREIAVGSLRWLAAGANRRLRNLKPEQLWLLLLRASLLAVLAVAVAGPVWQQLVPRGRGQVLLSPQVIGTPAFAALRPTVDSLRRRGYALRWLTPGFPKMSRAALRADSLGQRDSARLLSGSTALTSASYAERVRQAAGAFAGQPLFVATPATLSGFQGLLAPLPARVTWQTLPVGTATAWVQAAAFRGDSLRLLMGTSDENQTAFRWTSIAKPPPNGMVRPAGTPAYRLEAGSLQPLAGAKASRGKALPAVLVRTQPLRVVIYSTPEYALDARYLQAGVRATAPGLAVPLALSTTTAPPPATTPTDWLFWLSSAPLPAEWQAAVRKSGTKVWQETTGAGVADISRLLPISADEVPAMIMKRQRPDSLAASTASALWVDGQGRAVLSRLAQGQGAIYNLHTRLNPNWSNLADSPALPTRLLALLQPETTDALLPGQRSGPDQALAAQDQRALDPAQLYASTAAPAAQAAAPRPPAPLASRQTDLRPWFVLLAGLLFACERLLARRRDGQPQPSLV
ncbi:hypothetical protein BEN48_06275 [Hymenobacter glacialis]|uniref:Aerotolerance regulator N-terminal domain-containing protein n=1 Tax=Hymenobacter glacialis TaxID=1908236 RepID=A0A1G1SRI7_9BACT|nr:hypothetical protein BEN48_06275 [Hymenobacter glacialis]